eukprot:4328808-Alexandrium_andersonii.AAC.1
MSPSSRRTSTSFTPSLLTSGSVATRARPIAGASAVGVAALAAAPELEPAGGAPGAFPQWRSPSL